MGTAFCTERKLITFPKINNDKIREGIFVGHQIRQLIKDDTFYAKLKPTEKWVSGFY